MTLELSFLLIQTFKTLEIVGKCNRVCSCKSVFVEFVFFSKCFYFFLKEIIFIFSLYYIVVFHFSFLPFASSCATCYIVK